MNESFDDLNLSPEMAEVFIEKVSTLQSNLSQSQSRLVSCWTGASFDNLSSAIGQEEEKLVELQEHLSRIVRLITLINEHIAKKARRTALEAEIARLYKDLTYETWDEEEQRSETHERPEVRSQISRKEEEVAEINRRLDEIVLEIDAVTSI